MIWPAKDGKGGLFLSGLPLEADLERLAAHNVRLAVSVFGGQHQGAEARGGKLPKYCANLRMPLTDRRNRSAAWPVVLGHILQTLQVNESVLIHCMAGCHRAPLVMGLVLCATQGWTWSKAVEHMNRLRNVDVPGAMENAELRDWIFSRTRTRHAQPKQLPRPLMWVAADKSPSILWHISFSNDSDQSQQVYPLCMWNQKGAKFKDFVQTSTSEALTISTSFCNNCAKSVPGSLLNLLQGNGVRFRNSLCYDIELSDA